MTPTQELTNSQYDLADRMTAIIEAEPNRLWTASALARKARSTSKGDTYTTLHWLAENSYVTVVGNGAWGKYRARRFGEYATA